jgi:hypothetical protein
MEGNPQPVYSGYYRPGQSLDSRKLRALSGAYWGSFWLVPTSTLTSFAVFALLTVSFPVNRSSSGSFEIAGSIVACALTLFLNFLVALRYARMVALGRDRSVAYAVGLALYATSVSWCLCGLGAMVAIQQAAVQGLKAYGVRPRFLGVSRADIEAKIAEIQRAEAMGAVEE